MRRFQILHVAGILIAAFSTPTWGQVLNDPLNGSTIGTRENGAFVAGGWQVTNQYDTIYWHVPTMGHGSFEYNVKGLPAGTCPGGFGFKNELSHMYDWTFGSADVVYAPGYRDNPYKHFIRKQCESGKMDTLELVWAVNGPFFEIDTGALSWNSNTNYLWKTEWENAGGQAIIRIWRDGALVFQGQVASTWNPAGQSVRIAASPRRADEGANVGAIYSNVKVFDLNNFIPTAPTITAPSNGETVNTQIAYIQWSGDSHSRYQVRVNTQNNPDAGIVSDTGQVDTDRSFTWSGTLPHLSTCYAFVRLGSAQGWGPWSAGRQFTINTQFIPGGTDYVRVKGNTYANNSGPFLGLGFTHFRAMQRCKYDRPRYESDLAYMASKKFVYQRDLTMVSWCGLEIAPLSFNSPCGGFVGAWPDYWQQFIDHIDIAYSYGIKTQITIFAGAQDCMPNKTDRINHMQGILDRMPGREHKIVLIEVANESWQNGFGGAQGDADVHEFGQYLSDRTSIPVSLSSPADTSDGGIVGFYAGSAADISTVHFSRDIGSNEGGWLPVRDSYRTGVAGVPPISSNEPIGPGSSVSTENDPIKLCMAGFFAWNANLVSYVLHSRAGVYSWTGCCPPSGTEVFFSSTPGTDNFDEMLPFMPKDLSSWERNDGKAGPSPFTNYSMGQANKWWTEVGGATNGCIRNISAIKNGRFVTTPIGILGGGVQIQARRPMQFKAYNPLTGGVAYNQTLGTGASLTLAQGTGAYVIIGDFTDVPIDPGETSGGSGAQVTIDLGTTNIESGMTHPQVGDGNTTPANIGGRDCRRNVSPSIDGFMYFNVNEGYAFNGNKPNQFIRMEYYDTGTGALILQYDAISNPAANGPSVALTNTNTWKVATFNVTDAYFGNRLNGADYRIARGQSTTWYLDKMATYQKAFTGTPVSTPGTIQAEDFDNGGEDVAYNDTDVGNNGGQYRLGENVDIETCNEGGFNVGWIATGEYLTYQVNVTSAGNYDFGMRVAASAATTTYHIEMNGVNVTGTRTIAATGGIQTWATQTISNIVLSAGVQTMKLVIESAVGNSNFNSITIGAHQDPFGGTARAIPGIIQAEDFDTGGQGVAYNEAEATNFGGAYRTSEGVDITTTTDVGGGHIVGWVVVGEWMEYTVNVNQTGDYAIKVRLASASGGGLFHLSMNDVVITPTKNVGDTAGWDTWTTITIPGIFLTAGNNQVLRFTTGTTSGFNINHMEFVYGGADVISYDLSAASTPDGMDHPQVGDGNTIPDTIVGHDCHGNLNPGVDFYMYFSVADIYAFQGNKNNATITFDYLDNGTGTLTLQYDGTPSPYTIGQSVNYTNTTLWKTGVFTVSDAYFGNRQNAGADFRIARSGGVTFYIDTIMVFSSVGGSPPGAASNPSPANGATSVAITGTTLSWTAGSGATNRDVRFGTANPPPFIQNQTATTYSPGTLAAGTTYFWRIDEKNAFGTTTGTVWSFTTLPLPGLASAPNPANGATLVAITTDPSWTAGSNATSHDVRFGTVNPPPFVVNQTGTTYAAPTLTPNTVYFWRIDEKNGSGTTTGTVWSFTTLPLPGAASSPNPATGATLVNRNVDPVWTAGSNAASHDVRFGTTNPPPFVVNQTSTTYVAPTLNPNTVYFWRIDEINSSGTTTGTVWSFTTLPLPGAASAPNPANAATLVAITTDPSWTAGSNAASHDVRFGTVNPPPFVVNQTGTTYAAPTLTPNTVYFWRIDEVNSSGTTTGTVWSFTTLPLPGLATAPNPANAATGVSITPTLTWTAGSNATSHNVRFGTANPPPLIQNQAGTSYAPGTLNGGTVYFWRIDEQNSSGTTTGTVWSFTTVAGPVTFSDSAFPSNADGWNIVVWKSGPNADGTMAWIGTNGNPTGNMLSAGSGATNSGDNCTREGGEINKLISTSGRTTLQLQYDARFETNQTPGSPCFGTCPSGVMLGDCADKIAVWYSTAGTAGPWTLLESVNASSVTQNVWATRTVNLPTGANNQANFALRFRWQFNVSTDQGRLDNVKVIDLP